MLKAHWITMLFLAGFLAAGCSKYTSGGSEDECQSQADCNPGKTCGDMVQCVDGDCDPDTVVEYPCSQGCVSDGDCPEGMHCRTTGAEGECVADGTCSDVWECRDLSPDDCEGLFECNQGTCRYVCIADDTCGSDLDCVLADKGCCCGHNPDDYVAIHRDRLSEWQSRPECALVDCLPVDCEVEDLFAVCQQGSCRVQEGPPQDDCLTDSDCVEVPGDCCGCQTGGIEAAVPVSEQQSYLAGLEAMCAVVDVDCGGHDACTERPAVCHQGRCMLEGDWCGCPSEFSDWRPVCTWDPVGGTGTLPTPCHAECLGADGYSMGRCECMMDCYVGDPVCTEMGDTFWCGEFEAECNGQTVVYPAECSPECDACLMYAGPWIPVCGINFRTYDDRCFVECQDMSWWHLGECLPGEGHVCGGIIGAGCESSDLYCLIDPDMGPDAQGQCIKLGHCQDPQNCEYQGLPHEECVGYWTCPEHSHECTWECGP